MMRYFSLWPISGVNPFARARLLPLLVLLSAGLCLAVSLFAAEPKLKSTVKDRQSVTVTVYNTNLGLVKEVRLLSLPDGTVSLTFEGVASQIDPTSVHIRSLDHPEDLSVLEQNFEYDLIRPSKLMEKYLGKEIELITKIEKREKINKAKLIGIEGGYVYEINGKIAVNPPGRVVLPSLPEGLISKPSLIWLLDNRSKKHTVEASYLTGGMQWKANYVTVLSQNEKNIDLSGWVTIDNKSGATYHNASLKLIAGEIHRVQRGRIPSGIQMKATRVLGEAEVPFTEKGFFEYHMYTLQRKTTLKNNQTKQIRLMDAKDISVQKTYVYTARSTYFFMARGKVDKTKIGVFLSFDNSKSNNMGMPLPKGVVRVYKKDEDGSLEFLGEDEIDHTPEDERIRIKIGNAFDVVAERIQTDFKQSKNTYESGYKITIRNHKKEDITVSVVEYMPGDWKIKASSHKFVKETSNRVRFDVPVKSKGESELIYRVIVKR